jgi:hypothetical protein
VISPAFDFTAESLKAVEDMCLLLTNNYRTDVNETTGLHVHVGHRSQGFKFQDIQKLLAFLWTFDPMLETLHPQFRVDRDYVHSLRERSNFSNNWGIKWGSRPWSDIRSGQFLQMRRHEKPCPKHDRPHRPEENKH